MRSKSTVRAWSPAAAIVVAFALVSPVSAGTISRSDGDDSKSRLDISSIRVRHLPSGDQEFVITTHNAFTSADVRPPGGNFAISFDVNDADPTDGKWRYEYWVYAYSTAKGFRGVVYDVASGRVTANITASKPSTRSIRVVIPMAKIGGPDSYGFAAWSYSELSPCTEKSPCVDVVPNRLPLLLHDFTAPAVDLEAPRTSTPNSDTLAFPVTFRVTDDRFGAGLDRWKLQVRVMGSDRWKTVTSGEGEGRFTEDVTGVQGSTMETRVIAKDRAGNTSESKTRTTVVPFDDTDPAAGLILTFDPEWVASTGVDGAFLGTTHSVADATDAAYSFTYTGTKFCMIRDASAGSMTLTIDGEAQSPAICRELPFGEHTVEVTYTGTAWSLDGILIWP